MKCRQMVYLGGVCACLLSAGCTSVRVSDEDYARIDALNREGITWRGEAEKETFQPIVKMGPAVLWSFLPGAGQHFIAHKMLDGGFYDGSFSGSRLKLQAKGTLMIGVSWLPFVYPFTLISGMIGTVSDVNRVNNLALLESRMYPTSQRTNAQKPSEQKPSTQKVEVKPKRVKRGASSVAATQSQTPISASLTPEQQKKLEELETLHTAGLCTDDEYAQRRRTILTGK